MSVKKRITAILLSVLCMATGCTVVPPENTSSDTDASAEVSENTSSASASASDTSSEPTSPETVPPVVYAESSLSSVDRTREAFNVAEGKSYKSSAPTNGSYYDPGILLTDGIFTSNFDTEHWAGYLKVDGVTLDLDLGTVEQELADFIVCLLIDPGPGIGAPSKIDFSVSEDGSSYRKIGTVYPGGSSGAQEAALKLVDPVSARYVRFEIGRSVSAWIFLGELKVLKYGEDPRTGYYGSYALPTVSGRNEWPAEKQNTDTVNLIAGKKPLIHCKETLPGDLKTEYYNTLAGLAKLTDNTYATLADYQQYAFVHFTRGGARYLYFDLGYTSAVSGVRYAFLQQTGPAIYLPGSFSVALSEDGIGWQTVYTDDQLLGASETDLFRRSADFDHTYIARFVRISFTITTHVYCDELQLYGSTSIPSNALTVVPEEEKKPEMLGYVQPEDFLGVHNVMLSYNCLEEDGKHTENGLITVDEYLPYVGYYDTDGTLKDTFFDGFLYLPYAAYNNLDFTRTLDGWKFYLDDIYAPERNMAALDRAVQTVSDALSLTDYRCTVFTSILYPWKTMRDKTTVNQFGDLNGDGKNEAFSSLENRKAAVRWMMKQEYDRFCSGNYQNLVFGGFYWFEENLMSNSTEEKELIRTAVDYAHELGTVLFWIPYYCAAGYDQWKEYGFDVACMQPNYMFAKNPDESVLESTAEKTSMLGMCVEMEMNNAKNHEDVARYMRYLKAGVEYGFMNAVKMYYQGGVPGAFYHAYTSKDAYERSVYDLTYQYAKEKLTLDPPEYTLHEEPYVSKNGRVDGKAIAVSDAPFSTVVTVSPAHGSLRMNANGNFTYYPDEGFTGIDRFSVVIDFGFSQSPELIVSVSVG